MIETFGPRLKKAFLPHLEGTDATALLTANFGFFFIGGQPPIPEPAGLTVGAGAGAGVTLHLCWLSYGAAARAAAGYAGQDPVPHYGSDGRACQEEQIALIANVRLLYVLRVFSHSSKQGGVC